MFGVMGQQGINVNLTTNCITIGGTEIQLQPLEAELAYVLANAMPNGARHDSIISAVWGTEEKTNPGAHVKVLASKLRRKLTPHGVYINNVHSVGYRMVHAEAVRRAA
jgi:DNA-binding response OmpR family regulator